METYSSSRSITLLRRVERLREVIVNQALNCPDTYQSR